MSIGPHYKRAEKKTLSLSVYAHSFYFNELFHEQIELKRLTSWMLLPSLLCERAHLDDGSCLRRRCRGPNLQRAYLELALHCTHGGAGLKLAPVAASSATSVLVAVLAANAYVTCCFLLGKHTQQQQQLAWLARNEMTQLASPNASCCCCCFLLAQVFTGKFNEPGSLGIFNF